MATYSMAQAKRAFEMGYLRLVEVKRWDLTTGGRGGWFVWLGRGNAAGWLVDARDKEPRMFKSLDAAVSALEQVGFRVNTVLMAEPGA